MSEHIKVLSKEFGNYDDKIFIKKLWDMSVDELQKLVDETTKDLKWLKQRSKGLLGAFNRKDAQHVTWRLNTIKKLIADKKKNPNIQKPDWLNETTSIIRPGMLFRHRSSSAVIRITRVVSDTVNGEIVEVTTKTPKYLKVGQKVITQKQNLKTTYDYLGTVDNNSIGYDDMQLTEYGTSDNFDNYEDAVKYAEDMSAKQGVVQHVNELPNGTFKISDWYDEDTTVVSFERGIQLNENTTQEFEQLLKQHDWYYMMSDDNKKYTNGADSEKKLISMARQLGKPGIDLYNTYYKKYFPHVDTKYYLK